MANYFEILGVNIDSDLKEIKTAYVKKVREFPPEKEPEKYNEIRKAYETLTDEDQRIQYTAYMQYGDEIDELDKYGDEAVDNGDYERAITQYKKILLIESRLYNIQNKLALVLVYNKQYDEGIEILEELIEKHPDDSIYISNLSFAFKEKGELERSEELCLKSLEIDPYNEKNLAMLMNIYIEKNELDKAQNHLISGIDKYKTKDFREFIYYYEVLRVNTFKDNSDGVREGIKNLVDVLPVNNDIRDFVIWKISRLADELYERCDFTDSSILFKELVKLNKDNLYYKEMWDETKKLSVFVKEMNKFLSDDRFSKELKNTIYYYCTRFRMSHADYEEQMKLTSQKLESYKKDNPIDFTKEMSTFKKEYEKLYNIRKWYYMRLESTDVSLE